MYAVDLLSGSLFGLVLHCFQILIDPCPILLFLSYIKDRHQVTQGCIVVCLDFSQQWLVYTKSDIFAASAKLVIDGTSRGF